VRGDWLGDREVDRDRDVLGQIERELADHRGKEVDPCTFRVAEEPVDEAFGVVVQVSGCARARALRV